jgi:hypothetical protein
MKTLIRTIAILYVITAGIALAQVTVSTTNTPVLPDRPEKRAAETDAQYTARLRAWDTEVRRLTLNNEFRTTAGTTQTDSYEQPVRRDGESDAAYQARIREWKAEQDQQNAKNRQLLDMQKLLESSRNAGSFNTFGSRTDNMLVIPTEEMKTEDLLTINEDMNVMSQIFKNVLSPEVKATLGSMSLIGDRWVTTPSYGWFMDRDNNTLTSIYLQNYGALFLIKVDFPLSAPSETQEQPAEPDRQDVDMTWEQTRQQIYQPQQVASTTSVNTRGPDAKYDAQRIENLKTTLIKVLKHAVNIRALKPDESVILRIAGTGQSINIINVAKNGDSSIINYEYNGIRRFVIISGDLEDYIKSLSSPTVILIRAKKSDIDAFAKGEQDMEQFRQRVQIISYPLLQTSLPSTTTGRTSVPFGTTGTRGTTTGTSITTTGRRSSRSSEFPTQPVNETENYR